MFKSSLSEVSVVRSGTGLAKPVHVYMMLLSFSTVRGSIVRVLRNTPAVCSVAGVRVNLLVFCVMAPVDEEDHMIVVFVLAESEILTVQVRETEVPSKCIGRAGLLVMDTTGGAAEEME